MIVSDPYACVHTSKPFQNIHPNYLVLCPYGSHVTLFGSTACVASCVGQSLISFCEHICKRIARLDCKRSKCVCIRPNHVRTCIQPMLCCVHSDRFERFFAARTAQMLGLCSCQNTLVAVIAVKLLKQKKHVCCRSPSVIVAPKSYFQPAIYA